jgi:hypothetical protein
MRTIFLLPLTALVAAVAGCGSQARDQAAPSVPERDLTLVTQTPEIEIASPVELQRLRIQHRTLRHSQWAARVAPARRSSPLEPKLVLAAVAAPAPVLAAPEPVAQPASMAATPDNGRELLPGKTVTVIPASSGPSAGSDGTDELPAVRGRTMVAHGGGTCRGRGRGPGIGIAPAPRPDFR